METTNKYFGIYFDGGIFVDDTDKEVFYHPSELSHTELMQLFYDMIFEENEPYFPVEIDKPDISFKMCFTGCKNISFTKIDKEVTLDGEQCLKGTTYYLEFEKDVNGDWFISEWNDYPQCWQKDSIELAKDGLPKYNTKNAECNLQGIMTFLDEVERKYREEDKANGVTEFEKYSNK